jgi:hypothetical protein
MLSSRFRRDRSSAAVAGFETALAAALAALGSMLIQPIWTAGQRDLGYRTAGVFVAAFDPGQIRYPEARARTFYRQLLDRMRESPGVEAAALAQSVPLGYTRGQRNIVIAGERVTSTLWVNIVSDGYFDALRIPVLRGRVFDQRDTAVSAPVAVVNQELARRCGVDCRFEMGGRIVEVVGVVAALKYFQPGEPALPYLYLPFSQNFASRMVLHAVAPAGKFRAVLDDIRKLDPAQPVSEVHALEDYVQGSTFNARVAAGTVGIISICALLLALAGVYGAVSHEVAAQRIEIGVRSALGAGRWRLFSAIISRVGIASLGGTATGTGAALAGGGWIRPLDSSGAEPAFWIAIAAGAMVAVVSIASAAIPAWRASGSDPVQALRP